MEHFTAAACVTTCVIIFTTYSIVMKLLPLRRLCKLASKFNGPPGLPIIGNLLLFRGNTEDIMRTLSQLCDSYSTPLRLWLGHHLVLVVSDPGQIKAVCLSPKTIDKAMIFDVAKPLAGSGLGMARGERWHVNRRLIVPAFRTEILRSYIKRFAFRAAETAKAMEQHSDGSGFQLFSYLSHYATMATCDTTMSLTAEAQMGIRDYAEALSKIGDFLMRRALRPWLYSDFIFNLTKLGREQQKSINIIHKFIDNVIQKKKEEILERSRKPSMADSENDESVSIPQRKVFLEHMLQLSQDGKAFSDEDLRDETNLMTFAGLDTVVGMSAYVLLMLASHPEIQEKVYEELCEINKDYDSEQLNITDESLKRMTYLVRVIKETLRLFPVLPYMTRGVTDDLDIGEHTLPKGSQVLVAIFNVHRNGKYWPDPLKFDPDRFLPEEVAKRHPYAYIPFSAGPRNCIGLKYGMLSLKTLLATILWKYKLKKDNITPIKDIRLKMEYVLRTVDPISLRIERRTR